VSNKITVRVTRREFLDLPMAIRRRTIEEQASRVFGHYIHPARVPKTSGSPAWVRCSDRMPEDGQTVRVRDSKGNQTVAIYVSSGHLFGWMLQMRPKAWGRWPKFPPITFWRPVGQSPNAKAEPQPPQESPQ